MSFAASLGVREERTRDPPTTTTATHSISASTKAAVASTPRGRRPRERQAETCFWAVEGVEGVRLKGERVGERERVFEGKKKRRRRRSSGGAKCCSSPAFRSAHHSEGRALRLGVSAEERQAHRVPLGPGGPGNAARDGHPAPACSLSDARLFCRLGSRERRDK
jgi:hypothetical protein